MEILPGITAILGLWSIYKQSREYRNDADVRVFMDWLETHRFNELQAQLENNAELSKNLERILAADNKMILAKLGEVETLMTELLSRHSEFSGLAQYLATQKGLSDQELLILRSLVNSPATQVWVVLKEGRNRLKLNEGVGYVEAPEPDYLETDLKKLAELGLLDILPTERLIYGITRAARQLVEQMEDQSAMQVKL